MLIPSPPSTLGTSFEPTYTRQPGRDTPCEGRLGRLLPAVLGDLQRQQDCAEPGADKNEKNRGQQVGGGAEEDGVASEYGGMGDDPNIGVYAGTVTREELSREVWREPEVLTNVVDVCVMQLRKKIERPGLAQMI